MRPIYQRWNVPFSTCANKLCSQSEWNEMKFAVFEMKTRACVTSRRFFNKYAHRQAHIPYIYMMTGMWKRCARIITRTRPRSLADKIHIQSTARYKNTSLTVRLCALRFAQTGGVRMIKKDYEEEKEKKSRAHTQNSTHLNKHPRGKCRVRCVCVRVFALAPQPTTDAAHRSDTHKNSCSVI